MRILRRAFADTFSRRGGQLFSAAVAGFVGWLYLYFKHGEEFAVAEIPFMVGALVGTSTFVLVLFFWNLACAPYRIERDARILAETEREHLSEKLSEYTNGYYDFSEAQVAQLTARMRKTVLSEDRVYVIFAPSCPEALDAAQVISDAIKDAGICCTVHSGGMFPHNLKDRGICIYHGTDMGPSEDAAKIVSALETLDRKVSRRATLSDASCATIYVARPPRA